MDAFPLEKSKKENTAPSKNSEFEWIEPLGERELEVSRCIAEGLTNRKIAGELYLSLNTIKAHTRNIYGKIGSITARRQSPGREP